MSLRAFCLELLALHHLVESKIQFPLFFFDNEGWIILGGKVGVEEGPNLFLTTIRKAHISIGKKLIQVDEEVLFSSDKSMEAVSAALGLVETRPATTLVCGDCLGEEGRETCCLLCDLCNAFGFGRSENVNYDNNF